MGKSKRGRFYFLKMVATIFTILHTLSTVYPWCSSYWIIGFILSSLEYGQSFITTSKANRYYALSRQDFKKYHSLLLCFLATLMFVSHSPFCEKAQAVTCRFSGWQPQQTLHSTASINCQTCEWMSPSRWVQLLATKPSLAFEYSHLSLEIFWGRENHLHYTLAQLMTYWICENNKIFVALSFKVLVDMYFPVAIDNWNSNPWKRKKIKLNLHVIQLS